MAGSYRKSEFLYNQKAPPAMRSNITYFKYLYYVIHCGSLKKFHNYALNKIEQKLKKVSLRSLPRNVTIDPCNICNLRCPGCVTGARYAGSIDPEMLGFEQFKHILDQIKDYVFSVALYNWGEPFLNKDIFLMIDYATSNRVGTTVHSNFNVFDESMAEKSIRTGLTHIYLSIDGASQETYAKYRRRGNFASVLANVELLVEKKRKLKSPFPLLTWKYLVFPHNVHEIKLARSKAKALGVDAFEVFSGNLDNLSTFGIRKLYDAVSGNIKKVTADSCDAVWDSIFIFPDGSVAPCCQAFRKKDVFGNVYKGPLREVWNNSSFRKIRKIIRERKFVKDIRYPCCECHIIKAFQGNFEGSTVNGSSSD